jgi:hypothetical protein
VSGYPYVDVDDNCRLADRPGWDGQWVDISILIQLISADWLTDLDGIGSEWTPLY